MNNSNGQKKILLLWAPLADYMVACFRQLAKQKDVALYMVHQPAETNAPYEGFDLSFFHEVFVYQKEKEKQLEEFCLNLNPDMIMMSSWNYPFYMSIARKSKRNGTYVVSSFDGQWRSTIKQRVGILTSPLFLKPAIHNFFVPGDRQAIFARKLGYKNPWFGYYSARTTMFRNQRERNGTNKFIFVGRLVADKGVNKLISAYIEYRRAVADPWELVIVGKGPLQSICQVVQGVEVKEFVQPPQLPGLFSQATCLILPSNFEPWGVVIHEAVTSGLQVICTHACGASTMFVRDGQNGYVINEDVPSLIEAMKKISSKTEDELEQMSAISRLLGALWTTEKWADYVYDNICRVVK